MIDSTEALAPTPQADRPRWLGRPSVREALWGYVFIGPWLIGLVLLTLGPMIASFVMSLTNFNLIHPEAVRFVGLDNYVQMTKDPLVATSLVATFRFALITVPLTMLASLGFALLLNNPKLYGSQHLRTLVYMPILIPLVASTLVWLGFLNTDTGWLNAILRSAGLPAPDWINSEPGSTRPCR